MTIRQDLTIRQGETWSHVYTHRDAAGAAIDLTGYSARMAIKRSYEGATEAYLSTGADANGGSIALGGAAGTVTLSMTAAQSAALAGDMTEFIFPAQDDIFASEREPLEPMVMMLYNLELVSSAGIVTRALEGRALIYREITV